MRICGKGPDCLYAKYNFLFFIISFGGKYDTKLFLTDFVRFPWKTKQHTHRLDPAKQVPALYDDNIFHKENLVVTMNDSLS